MLFDDDEINMAVQSLLLMVNSG